MTLQQASLLMLPLLRLLEETLKGGHVVPQEGKGVRVFPTKAQQWKVCSKDPSNSVRWQVMCPRVFLPIRVDLADLHGNFIQSL